MKKRMAAYPSVIWMAIFVIVPLLLILYYSVPYNEALPGFFKFDFSHFAEVFSPVYVNVMIRSMKLALICTAICFALGYPVAYFLAERGFGAKSSTLFLIMIPMWMNFLLRTYSWVTVLDDNGLVNTVLTALGFGRTQLIDNEGAVILVMVYNFLPFMILPVYTVLTKIDRSLIESAQDLGADGRNVFFRLVFPLSIPGVISGLTMVFMPAVTTFMITEIVGGGIQLIGKVIERQFISVGNWNFGSALSMLLMVLILFTNAIFSLVDRDANA